METTLAFGVISGDEWKTETTFQGSGVTLAVVLEPALKHGHLLNRNFDQPAFTYWWLAGTGGRIKDSAFKWYLEHTP